MAKHKNKRPKFLVAPTHEKKPKSEPAESYFHLHPAWRISKMEMIDPFGWHKIPSDKVHEIRLKLGGFETQTWKEIILYSQKNHHFMSVTRISNDAQQRLNALRLDDTDSLFSLRLSGAERVWGILDNGILLVLWWDPFHQVYPVELKNT